MRPAPASEAPGAPDRRGLRDAFRVLRHRDFARMWSGAFVSHTGTWMQNTTVPWVIFKMTGSEGWLGLVAFSHFIPALLVGPIGGTIADRFPRKKVLLITQSGAMLTAFALWVAWATGHATPGLILTLVGLSGFIFGFGQAAWHSFVPHLVPREDLLSAVTLNSAQFNAARMVGPLLAGLTLSWFGPGAAFLVNAASYLAVLAALASIRVRPAASSSASAAGEPAVANGESARRSGGGFGEAVRYARGHLGIRTALGCLTIVMFLGSPVISLLAAFADEFHVDEAAYGALTAALGLGAVCAAIPLSAYGGRVRRSRLAGGSMSFFSVGVLGMSVAPNFAVGVVVMCTFGMGYVLVASSLNSTIQLLVEERFRGRVLALFGMSFTTGLPLGALVQARLAEAFGVRVVVGGAGFLLLAFSGGMLLQGRWLAALDGRGGDEMAERLERDARPVGSAMPAPAVGGG